MTDAVSSFTRYSALVGATFAGAATASAGAGTTVFSAPYATDVLPLGVATLIDTSVSTTGAWTNTVTTTLTDHLTANNPASLTLSAGFGQYDFTTGIVAGFESVSFAYTAEENSSGDSFGYTINGAFNAVTGSGTVSNLVLSAGDIFGFRVVVSGYATSGPALTISNLTATSAVPEPASAASWLGLGVAGVVAMREMRRRPRASAQA